MTTATSPSFAHNVENYCAAAGMVRKDYPDAVIDHVDATNELTILDTLSDIAESDGKTERQVWAWLRQTMTPAEALAWLGAV